MNFLINLFMFTACTIVSPNEKISELPLLAAKFKEMTLRHSTKCLELYIKQKARGSVPFNVTVTIHRCVIFHTKMS